MAMTLRPDEATNAALERLAAHYGVSKQQAAQRAILDRDRQLSGLREVGQLADEALAEWGPVFDELAK